MVQTVKLTEEGLAELVAELEELKSRRAEVAERIATAREFGDLSENAEYSAARDEQGVVETRIAELEDVIADAEVIETIDTDIVSIGSEVELERSSDKKKFTYFVVGSVESNPFENKISNESPIGEAILHKKIGEKVTVQTPKGEVEYKIISLK